MTVKQLLALYDDFVIVDGKFMSRCSSVLLVAAEISIGGHSQPKA